jgi:hypothetical protein
MKTIHHSLFAIAISLIFSSIATADTLSFEDGLEVLVPAHKRKTISIDEGTCIDASGYTFDLRICFYRKSFEDMAASKMFFEYRSLSDYEKGLTGILPEDSYVVSAGNWLHATSQNVNKSFQYYEATDVLCNVGTRSPINNYRDCYFAGMKPLQPLKTSLSIFVSSGYPENSPKESQTTKIRDAIRSIQILKFPVSD